MEEMHRAGHGKWGRGAELLRPSLGASPSQHVNTSINMELQNLVVHMFLWRLLAQA